MREFIARHIHTHEAAIALEIDAARYLELSDGLPRVFDGAEVAVFLERYRLAPTLRSRIRPAMTWFKFQRFVRRLVNRFEQTTVVSSLERKYLEDIGCDTSRIAVVPNGVEVNHRKVSLNRAKRLIYPGAVTYSANLDAVRHFVGEIFPIIRRSRPDFEFWVTGSTEGVDVGDLEAVEGVKFTGRLPEVDTAIAESTACVVPLRIGGGTRLKVLQAMAVGTPVVSTAKGIEGLDLDDGVHVLVADTPEAFAEGVLQLIEEPALGERLATAARRLVEDEYSWNRIGDTLAQILERAVDEFRFRPALSSGPPAG
jgi:glycosyltransferase involved in cell wall biosynthesis